MRRLEPAEEQLILASASPRRRELLVALSVPFVVRPVETSEYVEPGLQPRQAVRRIAEGKAVAALHTSPYPDRCHLAADTVVVLDGCVLGKPADAAAARVMLGALAGREHDVYTAVVLAGQGKRCSEVVRTRVGMRPYADREIESSIAAGTPFDKAGGYAIQDPLLHPVERCDGCYCNVMGLPLWTVYRMLHALRPDLPRTRPDRVHDRCNRCPLREPEG